MEFKNNTKNLIKVEVENTDPKAWKTIKPDEIIEAKSKIFSDYYSKVGLTEVIKEIPLHKISEKKEEEIKEVSESTLDKIKKKMKKKK